MLRLTFPLSLLTLLSPIYAQFPPVPKDITTIECQSYPGVSITYKETHICDTQVKAFAGYVHISISYLADVESADPFNLSYFFWYFQARNEPQHAPTTIYLAGGPGESSMFGAVNDGGPCIALSDSNSTKENPWSMNAYSNMLYVDQPSQTGFSYSVLLNSTFDILHDEITPFEAYNGSVPQQNTTVLYGTLPSQSPAKTANNSLYAAKTLWHFSQVWFADFPEYRTSDKRINIWGNSYGGFWVTVTADYFQKQNDKIKSGKLQGASVLPVDTIGFTNGFVDLLYQGEFYPEYAYNNTYGIQLIAEDVYKAGLQDWTKPNGCRDQIIACRDLGDQYDPDVTAANDTVNAACVAAFQCSENVIGGFDALTNRSDFDIAHLKPDPTNPFSNLLGFFNQPWVQTELGVPLNFSGEYNALEGIILGTGDVSRVPGLSMIEYLLDSGVKVALVYGDRDYRCPWNGGESLSLKANWTGADAFRNAGYEYIRNDETYLRGLVRQHGNFSFSRIFDSGHDAAAYQPETVVTVFNRAIAGRDVATGTISTGDTKYSSQGLSDSFVIKNSLPPPPAFRCNIWAVAGTCTIEQYKALANGSAKVVDYIVVEPAGGSPGALPMIV